MSTLARSSGTESYTAQRKAQPQNSRSVAPHSPPKAPVETGSRQYVTKAALNLPQLLAPGDWGAGDLAIVVPVCSPVLTPEEEISLRALARFAADTPRIVLRKSGVTIPFDTTGFRVIDIPASWMASLSAYNALMLEQRFYEYLSGYENVLIYQLDCILLGGYFRTFTDKARSFWGAPYFRRNGKLKSVGNGGFSLRRPADCLSVLRSEAIHADRISLTMWRQYVKPAYFEIWREHFRHGSDRLRGLGQGFCDTFTRAEDEFWIYFAPAFSRDYHLPSAIEAAAFAAESRSRQVIELNGGKLPLGAHAWHRNDRDLWEGVLNDFGLLTTTTSLPTDN